MLISHYMKYILFNETASGPQIRAVARAIAVLQAFDEAHPELGVTELSRLTGIDKSTVYRLLATMQQGGLVAQNAANSKYHLGLGLLRLAGLAVRQLDLPRLARPHMEELAELSGETVSLSILTNNDRVMNIDGIASPHMVRNVGWQGREMALHATSGGKVFLAFMDPARVEGIMAKKLEGYTQRTITDPGDLQNELLIIQHEGYAMAEEELEQGLSAVAAPIRNHDGDVIAIISLSGPSFRLPRQRLKGLGRATKQTTDAISRQLGYGG